MANISSSGSLTFGGRYSLTCTATVKGIIGADVVIEWKKIDHGSEQNKQSSEGVLDFTSLRVSDAGQYICRVSVASSYLTVSRNANSTKSIIVQSKSALCDHCWINLFIQILFSSHTQCADQSTWCRKSFSW